MVLGATVRQFIEKVEMTLRLYSQMDSSMFEDFFETIDAMNRSIDETYRNVIAEVKNLNA